MEHANGAGETHRWNTGEAGGTQVKRIEDTGGTGITHVNHTDKWYKSNTGGTDVTQVNHIRGTQQKNIQENRWNTWVEDTGETDVTHR